MAERLGCYNDTKQQGLGLAYQTAVHDRTTLEVCAGACALSRLPLAAIDAGNHCYCGAAGALQPSAGLARPMAEYLATSCHSAPAERCGGAGRLLAPAQRRVRCGSRRPRPPRLLCVCSRARRAARTAHDGRMPHNDCRSSNQ